MRKPSLNHIYRLVWNSASGTWVACAEVGAARGKQGAGKRARVALLASVLLGSTNIASAQAVGTTLVDGSAVGGCLVLSGSVCDATVSSNRTVIGGTLSGSTYQNATFTNFFTQGGAGSGGGAGLGGVFFVNTGATLNLSNVNFIGNVAKGGEGGSPLPTDLSAVSVGLVARSASMAVATSLQAVPTLVSDGSGGYRVSAFTLSNPNSLIGEGQAVTVGAGVSGGGANLTTVGSVSGSTVTLASAVQIDASNVASLTRSALTSGSATVTSSDFATLANSALTVGTSVVGTGIPAGTVVTAVNRDNSNNITSITLSNNATQTVASGSLTLVNVTSFDTAQFSRNVAGGVGGTSSITLPNPPSAYGLVVGMTVSGNGIPAGTTVSSISGNTVTFSSPGGAVSLPAGVNSFTGSLPIGTIGQTTLQLASPDSRFAVGSVIAGTGIPAGTTITAYNATTGVVTLSNPLTAVPSAVSLTSVTGQSGSSISLRSVSGLSVGMVVSGANIAAGTTIQSINAGTKTVTLSAPPSGAVTGFSASSMLSVGGSLNGIVATGTVGPNGGAVPMPIQSCPPLPMAKGRWVSMGATPMAMATVRRSMPPVRVVAAAEMAAAA